MFHPLELLMSLDLKMVGLQVVFLLVAVEIVAEIEAEMWVEGLVILVLVSMVAVVCDKPGQYNTPTVHC